VAVTLGIGTVLAGYRILGVLGRGGMGVVYRAEDLRLGRQVALKVLSAEVAADPAFRERFAHESRMLASIEHRNIVSVFHAGQADGRSFLAMRLVDGVDLGALLRQHGRLAPAAVGHIVAEVGEALDAAHAHGLVHRDVKPGNILVAAASGPLESAHVYLTDFGLTKRTDAPTELTVTGQFLGTVDYVAPEQIQGADLDGRADLYALACVAYECLAGHPPFHGSRDAAALMAHLVTKPPELAALRPDLPQAVSDVIGRGMAKNRDQRPATCAEFAASLGQALAGTAAAIHPAPMAAAPAPAVPAHAVSSGLAPPLPVPPPAAREAYDWNPSRVAGGRGQTRYGNRTPRGHSRGGSLLAPSSTLGRIAIIALSLLVLGAAGFAVLNLVDLASLLPGGAAGPSLVPSPTGAGDADEVLRNHIPTQVRTGCTAAAAGAPALAVQECTAEGGTIELRYTLFADADQMTQTYEQIRTALSVPPDSGVQGSRCVDPTSWPNEGSWTFRSAPSGRLLCTVDGGRPRMDWTDVRVNVLTHAREHAGDGERLYIFWRDGRFPAVTATASPPPTLGDEADQQQLRRHVPRGLRPACAAEAVAPPILAAFSCSADDGAIEVRYALYPAVDTLNLAYGGIRQMAGVTPDTGPAGERCEDPLAWPHEGPFTFRREPVGRVLCWMAAGRPRMDWSDERISVLSSATHSGSDALRLYNFWRSEAGPLE
jgi:hypothetical protein